MSWGDDHPIIGSDTDKTRKGNAVTDKDTYNMVGTHCKHCNEQNGAHKKDCKQNN